VDTEATSCWIKGKKWALGGGGGETRGFIAAESRVWPDSEVRLVDPRVLLTVMRRESDRPNGPG
jgi:hypothetical protein